MFPGNPFPEYTVAPLFWKCEKKMQCRLRHLAVLALIFIHQVTWAAPEAAPDRGRGEGPFGRLVLRGVTVINGEGAPPVGPMDVVIEGNRIASLHGVGFPGVPIDAAGRPPTRDGDKVLELDGHYLLPGFIDLHAHFGGDDQGVPAEYPAKLWLAHGITTIREPGSFNGLDWVLEHQRRSERNEIAAPRIVPYVGFGQGVENPLLTPEEARLGARHRPSGGQGHQVLRGAAGDHARRARRSVQARPGIGHASRATRRHQLERAGFGPRWPHHDGALVRFAGGVVRGPRDPGLSGGLQLWR
jgi:hypothetical protein